MVNRLSYLMKSPVILRLALLAVPLMLLATVVMPQDAYAAKVSNISECSKRILTFPTWFRGLVKIDANGECAIVSPDEDLGGGKKAPDLSGFIWRIVLNVIEIGLQLVGYLAVFFIIYGGFQFMTGGANPGAIEKARITLLNAVIGLAISIASIGLVNLVLGVLG